MSKKPVARRRASRAQCTTWYAEHEAKHRAFLPVAQATLEGLLVAEGIPFVSVTARVKTLPSLLKKVRKKAYQSLDDQLTDVIGVRAILYTNSDVQKASAAMSGWLKVQTEHSGDKAALLGTDRMGYRSVHFVCELGDRRTSLPEYQSFRGLRFELQVRTVLQHAWAEIEHDRSYKLEGGLPDALKRRLALVAGLLETADRELDAITREADDYAATRRQLPKGTLTAEMVPALVQRQARLAGLVHRGLFASPLARTLKVDPVATQILAELSAMGVEDEEALVKLLSDARFLEAERTTYADEPAQNWVGLVRDAMMWADLHRYFKKAWRESWASADRNTLAVLAHKYGDWDAVETIFNGYGVDIEDDGPDDDDDDDDDYDDFLR